MWWCHMMVMVRLNTEPMLCYPINIRVITLGPCHPLCRTDTNIWNNDNHNGWAGVPSVNKQQQNSNWHHISIIKDKHFRKLHSFSKKPLLKIWLNFFSQLWLYYWMKLHLNYFNAFSAFWADQEVTFCFLTKFEF